MLHSAPEHSLEGVLCVGTQVAAAWKQMSPSACCAFNCCVINGCLTSQYTFLTLQVS